MNYIISTINYYYHQKCTLKNHIPGTTWTLTPWLDRFWKMLDFGSLEFGSIFKYSSGYVEFMLSYVLQHRSATKRILATLCDTSDGGPCGAVWKIDIFTYRLSFFQKVHTFTSTRALAASSHSQPTAPDPGLSLRLQIFVHSTCRVLLLSFFLWLGWLAAAGCKLAGCLCSSFCSSCFDPCQCLCRLPSLNCVLFLKVFWLTGSWEIMIGKGNKERNT